MCLPNMHFIRTAAETQAQYMTDYYDAPWARYQSFGVGVVFGFLLWRYNGKIRIPKVCK